MVCIKNFTDQLNVKDFRIIFTKDSSGYLLLFLT